MSARPSDHVELADDFRGDNARLVNCIAALLEMDANGSLVPHGVGGHARTLLASAGARLAALAPVTPATMANHRGDWTCPVCKIEQPSWNAACSNCTVTPAGGVDWRAMYRFQTAMRFMDNVPKLTRDRAYQMADDEMRGLEAQTPSRDQGEG